MPVYTITTFRNSWNKMKVQYQSSWLIVNRPRRLISPRLCSTRAQWIGSLPSFQPDPVGSLDKPEPYMNGFLQIRVHVIYPPDAPTGDAAGRRHEFTIVYNI